MTRNVCSNLAKTICTLPRFKTTDNGVITKTVRKNIANGLKQYSVSGAGDVLPNGNLHLFMQESYRKSKGGEAKSKIGKFFDKLPFLKKFSKTKSKSFEDFFTKTTSTTPEYGDRALVVKSRSIVLEHHEEVIGTERRTLVRTIYRLIGEQHWKGVRLDRQG